MASLPRTPASHPERAEHGAPPSPGASCRRLRESLLARCEGVRLRLSLGLLLTDHLEHCPTCSAVAGDPAFLRTCLRVAPWLDERRTTSLPPAAAAAVDDHLRGCALCRWEAGGGQSPSSAVPRAERLPRRSRPGLGVGRHLHLAGRRTALGALICIGVLSGAGATLLHAAHPLGAPQTVSPSPSRPPAVSISAVTSASPTAGRPSAAASAAAAAASATRAPATPASAVTAPPGSPAATAAAAPPPSPTSAPRQTPPPSQSPTPAPIIPPLPTPPAG